MIAAPEFIIINGRARRPWFDLNEEPSGYNLVVSTGCGAPPSAPAVGGGAPSMYGNTCEWLDAGFESARFLDTMKRGLQLAVVRFIKYLPSLTRTDHIPDFIFEPSQGLLRQTVARLGEGPRSEATHITPGRVRRGKSPGRQNVQRICCPRLSYRVKSNRDGRRSGLGRAKPARRPRSV